MRPSGDARQRRRRKRAKTRVRVFIGLCAASLAMLICILLLLPAAFGGDGSADKPSALGITALTVEGNTRYDEEAILGESGIRIGQSVFAVNKRQAANQLKKTFHFVEDVRIDINLKREVTIKITEAEVMGAVYAEGQWVLVSDEGIGLQATPINSERPLRQLYIKGAGVLSATPGEQVLDDDSKALVAEIFDALQAVELTNITTVDIGNRTDIRLDWNNQITLLLGNDSNLRYEIAAAAATLPKVFDKHGKTVTGQLDLSQYSNPAITSPAIVFTPSALLQSKPQPEQ